MNASCSTKSRGYIINFLLPGPGNRISGGYKVVYHYANGLVARGHRVRLVHQPFLLPGDTLLSRARATARYLSGLTGVMPWRPDSWFRLDPRIELHWHTAAGNLALPPADWTIAAFWSAAARLAAAQDTGGRKGYLLQEYEYIMSADPVCRQRIDGVLSSGLKVFTISPVLVELLASLGVSAHYIPNGIELDRFELRRRLDDEGRNWVGFPARAETFKCTELAVQALEIVRQKMSSVPPVWGFGSPSVRSLPDWIVYHTHPDQNLLCDLYNRSAVFLVPSRFEGWGLPGSEAMACGAALVSTDCGGVRAYASEDETALLVPPDDPVLLADAVVNLLENPPRRRELACAGQVSISEMTWESAVNRFEAALNSD